MLVEYVYQYVMSCVLGYDVCCCGCLSVVACDCVLCFFSLVLCFVGVCCVVV